MKNILVSIITLTYNQEKFISKCIESILNQTYHYWEQIIIDDGSTDRTPEIVRNYKDPRIKYIYQDHKGSNFIKENYNKALGLCKGELIAICEGDDFWPNYKLEKVIEYFTNTPDVVLIYGITKEVTEDGVITENTIPRKIFKYPFIHSVLFNNPVGSATCAMLYPDILTFTFPCSVIIPKKLLEEIGGFQSIEGCPLVDYPTFLTISLKGKFLFIPEILGYWRRYKSSITFLYYGEIRRKIYKYIKEFIKEKSLLQNISDEEIKKIEKRWRKSWADIYFIQGRYDLLNRDWIKARKNFLKVLIHPARKKIFGGAILGFICSFFHLNFEFIPKILRRTYYKR